jgi:hypothetical protein
MAVITQNSVELYGQFMIITCGKEVWLAIKKLIRVVT